MSCCCGEPLDQWQQLSVRPHWKQDEGSDKRDGLSFRLFELQLLLFAGSCFCLHVSPIFLGTPATSCAGPGVSVDVDVGNDGPSLMRSSTSRTILTKAKVDQRLVSRWFEVVKLSCAELVRVSDAASTGLGCRKRAQSNVQGQLGTLKPREY